MEKTTPATPAPFQAAVEAQAAAATPDACTPAPSHAIRQAVLELAVDQLKLEPVRSGVAPEGTFSCVGQDGSSAGAAVQAYHGAGVQWCAMVCSQVLRTQCQCCPPGMQRARVCCVAVRCNAVAASKASSDCLPQQAVLLSSCRPAARVWHLPPAGLCAGLMPRHRCRLPRQRCAARGAGADAAG